MSWRPTAPRRRSHIGDPRSVRQHSFPKTTVSGAPRATPATDYIRSLLTSPPGNTEWLCLAGDERLRLPWMLSWSRPRKGPRARSPPTPRLRLHPSPRPPRQRMPPPAAPLTRLPPRMARSLALLPTGGGGRTGPTVVGLVTGGPPAATGGKTAGLSPRTNARVAPPLPPVRKWSGPRPRVGLRLSQRARPPSMTAMLPPTRLPLARTGATAHPMFPFWTPTTTAQPRRGLLTSSGRFPTLMGTTAPRPRLGPGMTLSLPGWPAASLTTLSSARPASSSTTTQRTRAMRSPLFSSGQAPIGSFWTRPSLTF